MDIDQGIHKVKMKVARNEKQKKVLGLYFYMNIGNFEAFLRNLNLSTKHLFWRCVRVEVITYRKEHTKKTLKIVKQFSKLFFYRQDFLDYLQVAHIYQHQSKKVLKYKRDHREIHC